MTISDKIKRAVKDPAKTVSRMYKKADYSAGKTIFGNSVGVKNNLKGSMKVMISSKVVSISDESKRKMIEEAKKKGCLKLGAPYYDKSLMERIQSKYNKMIEDDKYSKAVSEYKGKVYKRLILDTQVNVKEVAELVTDDVIEIVRGYYNGNFQIKRIFLWRNYHVPQEVQKETELLSSHWHCDNRPTDLFKLFVNISDVTEKDGPFHVQPRERTRELMNRGFASRDNYGLPEDVIEDPKHVMRAIGPSGSAMFANTELCLHRAGVPETGRHRDIIEILFEPSKESLATDWIDKIDAHYSENAKKGE